MGSSIGFHPDNGHRRLLLEKSIKSFKKVFSCCLPMPLAIMNAIIANACQTLVVQLPFVVLVSIVFGALVFSPQLEQNTASSGSWVLHFLQNTIIQPHFCALRHMIFKVTFITYLVNPAVLYSFRNLTYCNFTRIL